MGPYIPYWMQFHVAGDRFVSAISSIRDVTDKKRIRSSRSLADPNRPCYAI